MEIHCNGKGLETRNAQPHTQSPLPTQQRGQRPHVLLHQCVDLLLGEASDAVAVHLPAHHAAVQVAQQPLQCVTQGAAHRQKLLSFLQVVHPLTVGYRPGRTHTHTADDIMLSLVTLLHQSRNGSTCVTDLLNPKQVAATLAVCQEWSLTEN